MANIPMMPEWSWPGLRGPLAALQTALLWIGRQSLSERERWILFMPVIIGLGIAYYFSLPNEPPAAAGIASIIFGAALYYLGSGSRGLTLLAIAVILAGMGFSAAQWRTMRVTAPMLTQEIGPTHVSGRVAALDYAETGYRMTLASLAIEDLAQEETPRLVRISVRARDWPAPRPGDEVSLRAVLRSPSGPVMPGGFDFRRNFFFQGIGSVGGYATAPPEITPGPPRIMGDRLARLRGHIDRRIAESLPDHSGGIAVALLTGNRSRMQDSDAAALRHAGLAHLLAISGLHVGLVAGFVFFTLRLAMAAWPGLALNHPIKKYAAGFSLLAACGYMILVGAPVPTQRAVMMTGLVLLAIILDRTAISMRLVALAATVVLLIRPEALTGPSFQMSFAAVVALVAGWEAIRHFRPGERWGRLGLLQRIGLYFLGLAFTSLIAGLATAPFAMYHFNKIATYGLFANMLAVPLTALLVMPAGLLALVLMPFGLEGLALKLMGLGIEAVLAVAHRVAMLDHAVIFVPQMPLFALALITLGGLWLCLWRGVWRLAGLYAMAAGFLLVPMLPQPDILISDDGALMAVRMPDGRLALSEPRREAFTREIWLNASGEAAAHWPAWPESGTLGNNMNCDRQGCLYHGASGQRIGFLRERSAFGDMCAQSDLLIASFTLGDCPASRTNIIDRRSLRAGGSHAVYLSDEDADTELHVLHATSLTGHRPWTLAQEKLGE